MSSCTFLINVLLACQYSAQSTERTRIGHQAQQTAVNKLINRYVCYSLPRQMRKYVQPRSERQDPELDVEAHLGREAVRSAQKNLERKKRLRHISAWLWCKSCNYTCRQLIGRLGPLASNYFASYNHPFSQSKLNLFLQILKDFLAKIDG